MADQNAEKNYGGDQIQVLRQAFLTVFFSSTVPSGGKKKTGGGGEQEAEYNSANSWYKKGKQRPFQAPRFLADRKEGGGAGPVHQGKKKGAYRRNPGPAVSGK